MSKWHTTASPSLENDQECSKEAAWKPLQIYTVVDSANCNRNFAHLIHLDTFTFCCRSPVAQFSKVENFHAVEKYETHSGRLIQIFLVISVPKYFLMATWSGGRGAKSIITHNTYCCVKHEHANFFFSLNYCDTICSVLFSYLLTFFHISK